MAGPHSAAAAMSAAPNEANSTVGDVIAADFAVRDLLFIRLFSLRNYPSLRGARRELAPGAA